LKAQKRADRNEQILSLLAQGYSNKATAHKLEIDVKTVRRVRKGAKKRKPRTSKLDAFKPVIQELVVKKDLTAIRVLREIRALGYKGGYSVLKEYARSIRRRSRRAGRTCASKRIRASRARWTCLITPWIFAGRRPMWSASR
jgi:transposase